MLHQRSRGHASVIRNQLRLCLDFHRRVVGSNGPIKSTYEEQRLCALQLNKVS